jgi:phosphoribosylglycinamide formyltransferase-1
VTLGVLASGRGSNLGAILSAIDAGELTSRVAVVVSDVPEASALERARAAGIPTVVVSPGTRRAHLSAEAVDRILEVLETHDVEIVCLAGFMRILGPRFFEAFPTRILNIHPSLLPAFPGLEPQRRALEAGVGEAGCTVHLVTPAVDAGPILGQRRVPILPDDSVETLSARILAEEHRLYVDVLRRIEDGRLDLATAARVGARER